VGGKRSIVVGSDLGYGEDGSNEIPPNADLFIMDVEILEVKPRA
jgi:FKBP-type peptidyl-prolyl cis-trans isomerase